MLLNKRIDEVNQQIAGVREELHSEIREVRNEIHDFREELRSEIYDFREELRSEIHGVREELRSENPWCPRGTAVRNESKVIRSAFRNPRCPHRAQ